MRTQKTTPTHNRRRIGIALAAALACLWIAGSIVDSGAVGAGSIQADVPRADTPIAVDGRVYAGTQVGDRIIVGGTFTQVQPSASQPAIALSYLFVYDVNTGQLDPNQFVFNDRVNVVFPASEPDHVFVGGKFNTVNGETKRKLVKLDLSTGTVVTSFTAHGNGTVTDLALVDDTLYATGGFTMLNSTAAVGLGAVDAVTGATDASFDIALTGYIGQVAGAIGQRIAATPNGDTLIVMHRGKFADGVERRGIAMVDLTTSPATLTDWQTDFWDPTTVISIVDGEISPDGTYFVISGGWGDGPPWRDTAIAFPVVGGPLTQPLWVTRNHDSTFAVGIDDNAVYIGGHFCWTEGPTTPEPWGNPGPAGVCPNKTRRDATMVYRDTFAALDPATGRAIKYAPYTDANNGIRSIEAIPRGLLVGGDQTWTHDIYTGRSAFFDNQTARLNLALEGTATSSSQYPGSSADMAIDGLREGKWFGASIAATNSEVQPWWQVDLGANESVGTVELWGRIDDCCDNRLADVWVFASSAPFASNDPAVLAADPSVTSVFTPGHLDDHTVVTIGATAQYVRVQLAGTNYLELAEVQVYDTDLIAPDTIITSPIGDEEVATPFVVTGTGSDNVALASVELQIRNRDTGDWLRGDGTWGGWDVVHATMTPGGPAATWTFELTSAIPGRYHIEARSVDTAGNRDDWAGVKFEIISDDGTAPTVGLAGPLQDSTIPGATFVASGTATDNVDIAAVMVAVRDRTNNVWLQPDGSFGVWTEIPAVLTAPGQPTSGWSLAAALPAGNYRVYATAYDSAGNTSQTSDVRFVAN